MRKSLFSVFALVFLMSLGCGGSSSGFIGTGQCGSFTPCGGSIVGTWKLTSTCSSMPDAGTSNCPGEQVSTSLQYTGTLTFLSSGAYSVSASISGNANFTYPASCLTSLGMTCAQIDTNLKATGATDAGISGACTSASAGACACTETMKSMPSSEDGTYTTSGSALTMISSSSSTSQDSAEYCVRGNQLTIHITSAGSGGSFIITATK